MASKLVVGVVFHVRSSSRADQLEPFSTKLSRLSSIALPSCPPITAAVPALSPPAPPASESAADAIHPDGIQAVR
jgi:hypothetical protein